MNIVPHTKTLVPSIQNQYSKVSKLFSYYQRKELCLILNLFTASFKQMM